jgi:hypothetical protein
MIRALAAQRAQMGLNKWFDAPIIDMLHATCMLNHLQAPRLLLHVSPSERLRLLRSWHADRMAGASGLTAMMRTLTKMSGPEATSSTGTSPASVEHQAWLSEAATRLGKDARSMLGDEHDHLLDILGSNE